MRIRIRNTGRKDIFILFSVEICINIIHETFLPVGEQHGEGADPRRICGGGNLHPPGQNVSPAAPSVPRLRCQRRHPGVNAIIKLN